MPFYGSIWLVYAFLYYQTMQYVLSLFFKVFITLYDFSHMEDQEELGEKLAEYEREHKALDEMIDRLMDSDQPINLFEIQNMKKKKLWLKDIIQQLKSDLIDDIIA